ncbi:hypothetical protein [Terriglobus sp. RCC_193]|uniref:hypothetical protein n=1 Tax=Terriglobus sp. RCC_193 TaxID=3239218 RepID=UPI003525BE78
MARGWGKEDVDAPEPTPAAKLVTAAEQQRTDREKKRRLQELELQRERVLSERTSSPHRRSALEAALLEIERELAELGWAIHI